MCAAIEELCNEVKSETKTETAIMIARNMLSLKKVSLEDIAECVELPLEEIKELEKQLN